MAWIAKVQATEAMATDGCHKRVASAPFSPEKCSPVRIMAPPPNVVARIACTVPGCVKLLCACKAAGIIMASICTMYESSKASGAAAASIEAAASDNSQALARRVGRGVLFWLLGGKTSTEL